MNSSSWKLDKDLPFLRKHIQFRGDFVDYALFGWSNNKTTVVFRLEQKEFSFNFMYHVVNSHPSSMNYTYSEGGDYIICLSWD